MNLHSNARTCPNSRATIVGHCEASSWSEDYAAVLGVSSRTGYKWFRRFREEGLDGLQDRSSRPRSSPSQTDWRREDLVINLRHCRLTGAEIARKLRMPRSTVAAILKRAGLSRLGFLEPPEPIRRYERDAPGDLIHLDIKKLARIVKVGHRITGNRRDCTDGAGWEYVHVAIDDASRLAYVEVLANEQAPTTSAFFRRALIYFRRHGLVVKRVMTDNGPAYRSDLFGVVCVDQQLRHLRTKPYRPQTNGKAERFIQSLIREWAYKRPYPSSTRRLAALPRWLEYYNRTRPHAGLGGISPFARVAAQC
jgi:transposase InsO family protein